MKKESNQEIERHYFEMFRKDYPLPHGIVAYADSPDVILNGDRKIGIEITNFYLGKGHLTESEQAQRKMREGVVTSAQHNYQKEDRKKIGLSIGFDKNKPIRDQKKLTHDLVDIAKRIEGMATGQIAKDIFQDIPEVSFVYLNANEYGDAKWRVVQVYEVPIMSRDRLIEIVRDKETRSRKYKKCDAYWLVVVVDFINMAQDQEIRIDNFEKLQSKIFERIIVYKTLLGHVLEAK